MNTIISNTKYLQMKLMRSNYSIYNTLMVMFLCVYAGAAETSIVVLVVFVCASFVRRTTMTTVKKTVHTMETPLSNSNNKHTVYTCV